MSILGEPLYEVSQESSYYKDRLEARRLQEIVGVAVEAIEEVNGFHKGSLVIWNHEKFGLRNKEDQEAFA